MYNKVLFLVFLILVTNLISSKKTEKLDYDKWEHLNIQIISSLVESACEDIKKKASSNKV